MEIVADSKTRHKMKDHQKDVLTVAQAEHAPSHQYPVCASAWRPINNDSAHTKMAAHAATREKKKGRKALQAGCVCWGIES